MHGEYLVHPFLLVVRCEVDIPAYAFPFLGLQKERAQDGADGRDKAFESGWSHNVMFFVSFFMSLYVSLWLRPCVFPFAQVSACFRVKRGWPAIQKNALSGILVTGLPLQSYMMFEKRIRHKLLFLFFVVDLYDFVLFLFLGSESERRRFAFPGPRVLGGVFRCGRAVAALP